MIKELILSAVTEAYIKAAEKPVTKEDLDSRQKSTQRLAQSLLFPSLPDAITKVIFSNGITVTRVNLKADSEAKPWTPVEVRVHLKQRLNQELSRL